MKNCTLLWREVKKLKAPHVWSTFGSWDVEKVHAVVPRSTCPSQNAQSTPTSDHFWKLWCQKSARHCGAEHISKSKRAKHTMRGPFLEVDMSRKWTPLWRKAHFQVESVKNWGARNTFGRSDVVLRGRCKEFCTLPKVSKTCGFCSSFSYNHHHTTLHSTPLHSTTTTTTTTTTPTTTTTTTIRYTTFNYTTLRYTTLQLQRQLQLQLQVQLQIKSNYNCNYITLH